MKRKNFVTDAISFDDFMSHPESQLSSGRSATDLAAESQQQEQSRKKQDQDLKRARQKAKRSK